MGMLVLEQVSLDSERYLDLTSLCGRCQGACFRIAYGRRCSILQLASFARSTRRYHALCLPPCQVPCPRGLQNSERQIISFSIGAGGGGDRYLSLYARACALSHASNLCRSSASWETSGQRTAQSTRAPARCASHAKPATSSTRRGLATSMLPRMCSVSAGSAQCLRLPTPAPLRLLSCTRMAVTTWKHRTIERGAEALHSRLRATTPALVLRGQLSNSPTPRTPQCRYHLPRALPLQGASASLGDSRGP